MPGRLADVVERRVGRAAHPLLGRESGWWTAPERIGDRIAPLVGAGAGQVVVGDSTSVNVFKAVVGAVRIAQERRPGKAAGTRVLVDATTFPTDGYIAESAARMTGCTRAGRARAEMADAAGPATAVALVNHVDYRTGRLHDLPALTAAVHAAGGRRRLGPVPQRGRAAGRPRRARRRPRGRLHVQVPQRRPGFARVPVRTPRVCRPRFDSPLPGWNSHADPFAMTSGYVPADGASRGRVGTPDILSMLALEAALEVWDGVDIEAVRAKSLALTDFFLRRVRAYVPDGRLRAITPEEHERRGSQVSLMYEGDGSESGAATDAESVMAALQLRGVIGDFRPPGVLRFGFAPLYTSFTDAERAAGALGEAVRGHGDG